MGRKLGATPRFGKAAKRPIIVVREAFCVHPPGSGSSDGAKRNPGKSPKGQVPDFASLHPGYWLIGKQKARADRPGLS